MQIVSWGDNLHNMPNPFLRKNKKSIVDLSSAEIANSVQSDNL